MNSPEDQPSPAVLDEAAAWVIRQDRGLTAEEQDRLSEWLAGNPRHGEALARQRAHWDRLAPLGIDLPALQAALREREAA